MGSGGSSSSAVDPPTGGRFVNPDALKRIEGLKPHTILYLYSGGKDSSLTLLFTRDAVRELAQRVGARVYMLYIAIAGNTHPLNAYAAAAVMEWHRRNYGFEPLYRCSSFVFQEGAAKWGLQKGPRRWCYVKCKHSVLREVERELPKPLLEIDGMAPSDALQRDRLMGSELEEAEASGGTRFWAWHPLFSLRLSEREKLDALRRHREFEPVVLLYEEFGDSMNCVVCPYKPLRKMRRYRLAEDARILQRFAQVSLKSEHWRRYFNGLLDAAIDSSLG
jgi:3'-phosphoadenosine 5'-phosphosulfate sulfotransferase (PAPS reductase)/FAD synthetase